IANEESDGRISCISEQYSYQIDMYPPDHENSIMAGKRACIAVPDTLGERVCKSFGGKEIEDWEGAYFF
ncbi:MAG: hypothetical protein J6Q05_00325, partial [Elusimicrobiaceae bacterium]|nr:hypothetical protein [Elusimicrobiaceae bacterium]